METTPTLRNLPYSNILDKLCELDKPKRQDQKYKSIIFNLTIAVISTIITVFICIMIYKTDISVEGIISVLLAFFSIFISVFFYMKASDTSNSFYDRSYDIMKDVSVSLGKIEERFGERLNSMNNTLSSLSLAKVETKQDLQQIEIKKDKIIQELMHELEQKGLEQEKYKKMLNDLDMEAHFLRNKLIELESDEDNNFDIRHSIGDAKMEKSVKVWVSLLGAKDKNRLMNGGKLSPENKAAFKIGMQLGFINEIGILTSMGKNVLNYIF